MVEPSLELLQTMVQRVLDGQATMQVDLREVKTRLATVERGIAGLRRDQASDAEQTAEVRVQVDRLADRVARIERRLDLTEA